jgi:iron(III) transport system substrate-binding protein
MAYNPQVVPTDQAPKNWKDLQDPKWKGGISVKATNSGLQFLQWYALRKLYGPDFWKQVAPNQPKAFDAFVQQFDRLVSGEDKVAGNAQYSGVLQYKEKGAPIEFINPPDGLAAGPEVVGVVTKAPHPEAAKLYVDWLLSSKGQQAMGQALYFNSPREDVPPPHGALSTGQLKLLIPTDWNDFLGSQKQYQEEWNSLTGLGL